MKTVKKVSNLTGVSVRMLHHYDKIGLLTPAKISDSGYRLYDEKNLIELQQILFFKELDFSLEDIKSIIKSPVFDRKKALSKQKELLILKKDRLNNLIKLIDKTLKGENNMSFEEFNNSEIQKLQEEYSKEIKEKYGETSQYKEFKEKTANYSKNKWEELYSQLNDIFKSFSEIMKSFPDCKESQNLVAKLQKFISSNYYYCSDEFLNNLGQMYVCDERFRKNIDKIKPGLAKYVNEAIKIYCNQKNKS